MQERPSFWTACSRRGASVALVALLACAQACDGDKDSGKCKLECGVHGRCDQGNADSCVCDTGYSGAQCDDCANGFSKIGGVCIADENPPPPPLPDPYFGSPTIDGEVSEDAGDWTAVQRVGGTESPSNWSVNRLTDLYVAYDQASLYIGVRGFVEAGNALVVYIDTDYGAAGPTLGSPKDATDNSGALDNAVSANIEMGDPTFRSSWAVGTKGMASVDLGPSDDAGWRRIGTNSSEPGDFAWVEGDLQAGSNGFEASLPLASIFGGPVTGMRQLGLFARVVSGDGQGISNQTVPEDNPSNSRRVSVVAVANLNRDALCDNDGTCDFDERYLTCPEDCPRACGNPSTFDWQDAVMYFALVDRFFDSDGVSLAVDGVETPANYRGGDWAGVEAKLDYIQGLGVNTIWLSAPYENRNSGGAAVDPVADTHVYSAYHGYWPSPKDVNYGDIDHPSPTPPVEDRLGTSEDLTRLIQAAHERGMRVLFDYVMKHADVESELYQAHYDWFVRDEGGNFVTCYPNNWNDSYWSTRCAFTPYLAPFDFYNPTVRAWSVHDAVYWARAYGIDGYRLDAIKHVPIEWLHELRQELAASVPPPSGGRFYLVGETYDYDSRSTLRSFIDSTNELDGQFDFPLRKRLCDAFFNHSMSLDALFAWLDANDAFYKPSTLMSTWIGNHDIPRAIHFASGQITDCYTGSNSSNGWVPSAYTQPTAPAGYERLGLAFGLLMTNRGVPMIYYGDEIGLAGGGDPDNRRMMTFSGLNAEQSKLRNLISALGRARAQNIALRRGVRQTVAGGIDTFIYKMTGCGERDDVYVLVNRADEARNLTGMPAGTYRDLFTDEARTITTSTNLPARSLLLLKPD